MGSLTGFIIVLIAITFQFTLNTINRLQEPLEHNLSNSQNSIRVNNSKRSFWKKSEITNGSLAMVGLLVLVLNYGFFGWIIPGFI